jgi:hypothetical protein
VAGTKIEAMRSLEPTKSRCFQRSDAGHCETAAPAPPGDCLTDGGAVGLCAGPAAPAAGAG